MADIDLALVVLNRQIVLLSALYLRFIREHCQHWRYS